MFVLIAGEMSKEDQCLPPRVLGHCDHHPGRPDRRWSSSHSTDRPARVPCSG